MLRLPILLLTLLLGLPALADSPRTLRWSELIPADAAPAPLRTQPLHEQGPTDESGPRAAQQQPDAPTVEALHGQLVRLPGYLVPLEIEPDQTTREFLLVPYYGACIHVPPPPANQTVHVRHTGGVRLDALWQPYWIEGRLRVERVSSELAVAGYRMEAVRAEPYAYEE